VVTSGGTHGRAPGGVADTLAIRSREPDALCDDALEPFRTAFARSSWRGRLRRLHGEKGLRLHQNWATELGLCSSDVDDIVTEPALGATWSIIEDRSPLFARQSLRPGELSGQIAIARRSLALLRDDGSGARQHVEPEIENMDPACSTTHLDPTGLMKKAESPTHAVALPRPLCHPLDQYGYSGFGGARHPPQIIRT
jgi:hypothetical protein